MSPSWVLIFSEADEPDLDNVLHEGLSANPLNSASYRLWLGRRLIPAISLGVDLRLSLHRSV